MPEEFEERRREISIVSESPEARSRAVEQLKAVAMRILYVSLTYYPRVGGVEYVVKSVAERLAKAGHEVSVLAGEPDAERLVEETKGRLKHWDDLRKSWRKGIKLLNTRWLLGRQAKLLRC